jgi:hypothetical protein
VHEGARDLFLRSPQVAADRPPRDRAGPFTVALSLLSCDSSWASLDPFSPFSRRTSRLAFDKPAWNWFMTHEATRPAAAPAMAPRQRDGSRSMSVNGICPPQ